MTESKRERREACAYGRGDHPPADETGREGEDMEGTTTLRAHERTSPHRSDGSNITVCQRNMKHIYWLYKMFRYDGMKPGDARMCLVFALAAGQRDMRTRVEDTLRTVR